MRLRNLVLSSLVVGVALSGIAERRAEACGGCFSPPGESNSVVTDHRMILSISPQQTTLYDQIKYSGSPSSFAWVLPISGSATIGLSSDAVFGALDQLTETRIQAPPPPVCSPPSRYCRGASVDASAAFSDAGASPPPVDVTRHEVVGPYETVQLHSSDPNALTAWLTSHGYGIPDDVKAIVTAYVNEHFDFLAMKLVPGASVQSMRPVRVTVAGASPVLPLRMVAAGTGATVGITLWVVGEGRYEPQNFPFFSIPSSEIVWDYATASSNYRALRTQKEAALAGRGWQVESATSVDEAAVRRFMLGGNFGPPRDAGADYDPVVGTDGGPSSTADQVREQDLHTLFAGVSVPRVTRIRADLAHASLATDLVLQAATDQGELPRFHYVQNFVNVPVCPPYPEPPPCPPDADGGISSLPGEGTPSNGKDSFSCSSTTTTFGGGFEIVGLAALVGLGIMRSRRRRPPS